MQTTKIEITEPCTIEIIHDAQNFSMSMKKVQVAYTAYPVAEKEPKRVDAYDTPNTPSTPNTQKTQENEEKLRAQESKLSEMTTKIAELTAEITKIKSVLDSPIPEYEPADSMVEDYYLNEAKEFGKCSSGALRYSN